MNRPLRALLTSAVMVALVAACGSPSGSSGSGVRRLSGAQMLAHVRAAGQMGRELDVQPIRDPQIEDLRGVAAVAEQRGDYDAADAALLSALRIRPGDPDVVQWRAELALVRRDWSNAEKLALQSYESGPRLGGLCRRNWTTLQLAREARGDAGNATIAQQRVGQCIAAPPVRM